MSKNRKKSRHPTLRTCVVYKIMSTDGSRKDRRTDRQTSRQTKERSGGHIQFKCINM